MSYPRRSPSVLFCCAAAAVCQLLAQSIAPNGAIWTGKSGKYAIEWSTTNLRVTRAARPPVVFDAASEAKSAWSELVRSSDGAPMEAEFTYRLLSVVGPYLSLEEGVYCNCGGAHPTAVKRFRAIELERSSKPSSSPASLTSIFPERAVFAALQADTAVAKAIRGNAKPQSLESLLQTLQDKTIKLKDCEYEFPDDLRSSFAFYDAQDGSVSVRIGLPAAAQVCRAEMIQLGLTLPIPQALRAELLDAKERRSGLLIVDGPRNGSSAVTRVQFSQKGSGKS